MRISDWSSDVCSSDLPGYVRSLGLDRRRAARRHADLRGAQGFICDTGLIAGGNEPTFRRGGLRVGANDVQPEIGLCDRGLYGGPVGSSVRDGDPSRSLAAEFDRQRKRCGRFEALRATVRAGTSDIFSFDHDAWIGPEPRDAPSRFGSANVRRGGFERRRNDAGKFESAIDCERWAY